MRARRFRVGDRVLVRFLRYDGTEHRDRGTIVRLWGRRPHAATVDEDRGGRIRVSLNEMTKLSHHHRIRRRRP